MAEQRQLIYKILLDLGNSPENAAKGAAQIDKITSSANQASAATENLSKKTKALNKLQEDQARSAGLAGATAFELGRTISDLPFGIVAVTNNISQMGTLFAALVANAGGLRAAFAALRAQLMGPAGILVAFQVVVAAITFFAQRANRARAALDKINTSLEGEIASLNEIKAVFSDINSEETKRVELTEASKALGKDVADLYKSQALTAADIVKLAEQELIIRENQVRLEEDAEDRKKKRSELQEQLNDLDGTEEKIQKRIAILRTKGFTEEEAINEINRKRVGFFGGLVDSSLSMVKLGEDRKEIEGAINELVEKERQQREAIVKAQRESARIKKEALLLEKVTSESFDARLDLEEKILKAEADRLSESEIQQVEAELSVQKELFTVRMQRLDEAERRELEGITNPRTIQLIKDKYKTLAESSALDFKAAVEGIVFEKVEIELQPVIVGEDLLDGPDLTEAQKFAGAQLEEYADGLMKKLRSFVRTNDKFKEAKKEVEKEFSLQDGLALAQQSLDSMFGLFESQFEREVALEQTKTIAINDQLRERLRNEKLSAEQRDEINQQIARNDAELLKKQNEIERKRFQLNKAAAISNAIISTASAVVSALDDLPVPANFIAAGVVGAAGAAQIAAIANQQFVPQASPNPRLSALGGGESSGPSFNVVGSSTRNQLAEAVSSALSDKPIKAFVVSSDVSSAQELDRKIVEGASI